MQQRDEFLEQVYGSSFKKDKFYALLPTKEDGLYRPDESDMREKSRREQMIKEMNDSASSQEAEKPVVDDEASVQPESEQPVSVPMGAGGDGGGSSISSGDSGTSSPPPPPPPPPSDDGGGGFEEPPPPPPPPEDMGGEG